MESNSVNEEKETKKKKINELPLFDIGKWTTVTLIFLSVLFVWLFFSHFIKEDYLVNPGKAGQLGDSYGWLTSLFSAFGFAGLLITILLQGKELKETRAEFSKQNVTMKRQRFENTFFSMLTIHFGIVGSIKYSDWRGAEALDTFTNDYGNLMQGTTLQQYKIFGVPYQNHSSSFVPSISPYLQSLIALYMIIKRSKFKPKAEERYLQMLRSYISFSEVKFLYYHVLLSEETGVIYLLKQMERDLKILETFPDKFLCDPSHGFLKNELPMP